MRPPSIVDLLLSQIQKSLDIHSATSQEIGSLSNSNLSGLVKDASHNSFSTSDLYQNITTRDIPPPTLSFSCPISTYFNLTLTCIFILLALLSQITRLHSRAISNTRIKILRNKLREEKAARAVAEEKSKLQETKLKLQDVQLKELQVSVMEARNAAEKVKIRVEDVADAAGKTVDEIQWPFVVEGEGDEEVKGWLVERFGREGEDGQGRSGEGGDGGVEDITAPDEDTARELAEVPAEVPAEPNEEKCVIEPKQEQRSVTDNDISELIESAEGILQTCRGLERARREKREKE